MKIIFYATLLLTAFGARNSVLAREVSEPIMAHEWSSFRDYAENLGAQQRKEGTAYVLSGSLALVGGGIGYHNSQDPFARAVFTISQSMGIAAIGYGIYLHQFGNEEMSFYRVLQSSSLSDEQKSELVHRYMIEKKSRERNGRWIKVVTHGLIAALNFYNGSQQNDAGMRTALYFVGGVNAIAALSFSF